MEPHPQAHSAAPEPAPPHEKENGDLDLEITLFEGLVAARGRAPAAEPRPHKSKPAPQPPQAPPASPANPDEPARGALRFRDVPAADKRRISTPPAPIIRASLPASREVAPVPYRRTDAPKPRESLASQLWERATAPGSTTARLGWVTTPAALIAAVSIGAGVIAFFPGKKATPPPPKVTPAPVLSSMEQTGREVFQSRAAIEGTLRKFHDAQQPESKACFIRSGATLLPELKRYYSTHPAEPAFAAMDQNSLNWVDTEGRCLVYGLCHLADGSRRQFTVELTPEGCLLDWQALTGWTGTDWGEFLAARPQQPVTLCVSAVPDTLFTGPFSDPVKWICLKVQDPAKSQTAWTYLRRDSEAASALPDGFAAVSPSGQAAPGSARRITLDLKFPGDAPKSGVPLLEVTSIRHEGWFQPKLDRLRPPGC